VSLVLSGVEGAIVDEVGGFFCLMSVCLMSCSNAESLECERDRCKL
jgi:hypothetical protein